METNNEDQKAIVPIGPNGLEFKDIDALFRFAKAVELSGLAPKGLEKKEAVFIALCMAIELRMSPMSALQNIAVINGRPGIYGDAALALVRASGLCEKYSQELTGEGDGRKAIVRSSRGGVEIVNEFSVADAKRAQLWGKSGPWSQYPDRMLIFRARGFNLRDNFGDVLKGFRTTEELADIPEEKEARAIEIKSPEMPKRQRPAGLPVREDHAAREKALERLAEMKDTVRNVEPSEPVIETGQSPAGTVRERLAEAKISESSFMDFLRKYALSTKETSVDQVEPKNLQTVLSDWDAALDELRETATV